MFRLSAFSEGCRGSHPSEFAVFTRGGAGTLIYIPKGGIILLRLLNVSREPLFVFEFVETLFAFA